MERETGINVVEKKRLRDAITRQVHESLERGGRITVLRTPTNGPPGAAQGGARPGSAEVMACLD